MHSGSFQIKQLIHKFIKKQETISLVVVPANVDIATTEALKMAQEVDPSGERTLGEGTVCYGKSVQQPVNPNLMVCAATCRSSM